MYYVKFVYSDTYEKKFAHSFICEYLSSEFSIEKFQHQRTPNIADLATVWKILYEKKNKNARRNSLHTLPSVIIRCIRDLDGRHAKSATNIYETTEKKNLEKKLKYQSSNFAAS